jgi:hypothetical protein
MMHRSRFSGYALFCAATVTLGFHAGGETVAQQAPKLAKLDLSKANEDYAMTMDAPPGAKAKDGILGVEISNGSNFQVELGDAKDMASLKKEIEKNPLNQLKKIHVETKDVLLYESQIKGQPNTEFHFLANVPVGGKTVGAEDMKGGTYTKAQAELMVKCVQSLKSKK